MSRRSDAPFVEVNCAAIPEELIESELFGYEKGAFTGADAKKLGKFDSADGGTIFLDEIGDMSTKTQAKILRILQEGTFARVGGTKTITVDVRVIAATNQNLTKKIREGTFREDLYFRLNVLPLVVPPLRDRSGDIPLLVDHFINEFSKGETRRKKTVDPRAVEMLMDYHWPGNVRELKNLVERLTIMTKAGVIGPEDIPDYIRGKVDKGGDESLFAYDDLKEARDHFERLFIEKSSRKTTSTSLSRPRSLIWSAATSIRRSRHIRS